MSVAVESCRCQGHGEYRANIRIHIRNKPTCYAWPANHEALLEASRPVTCHVVLPSHLVDDTIAVCDVKRDILHCRTLQLGGI